MDASIDAMNSSDDAPVVMACVAGYAEAGDYACGRDVQGKRAGDDWRIGDAGAAVFYTTNGKRPTTSSQRYAGPIAVSGKTKVEAMAFDVSMQPSGVVSKTFKVKAGLQCWRVRLKECGAERAPGRRWVCGR